MKADFLSLTTPTNLELEREKFFASNKYHPHFRYVWQDRKVAYYSANPLKQKLINLVLAQDQGAITSVASLLFETEINDTTTSEARQIIKTRHDLVHSGSSVEFARHLASAFELFKIPYSVEIVDESGFNARPNHHQNKVVVSSKIHYEMFSMEGGVRHDLTHIMRYLNGKYNNIKRSKSYLPTEEGLASYAQDNVKGVVDNGKVQHAIEYLGTSVGVKGSLRDIYNIMVESGMSQDLAWKRASRHKFGFVNTSEPGDIMKPAMYFANELKITKLRSEDKLRLYVGKISLDELDNYQEYTGLWERQALIDFFNL